MSPPLLEIKSAAIKGFEYINLLNSTSYSHIMDAHTALGNKGKTGLTYIQFETLRYGYGYGLHSEAGKSVTVASFSCTLFDCRICLPSPYLHRPYFWSLPEKPVLGDDPGPGCTSNELGCPTLLPQNECGYRAR
jgi:hypothetical protein